MVCKDGVYSFYDDYSIPYKSRWQRYRAYSETSVSKSHTLTTKTDMSHIILIQVSETSNKFIPRFFSTIETERLFTYPDGYVGNVCSHTRSVHLLGNSVVVNVIKFIVSSLEPLV